MRVLLVNMWYVIGHPSEPMVPIDAYDGPDAEAEATQAASNLNVALRKDCYRAVRYHAMDANLRQQYADKFCKEGTDRCRIQKIHS